MLAMRGKRKQGQVMRKNDQKHLYTALSHSHDRQRTKEKKKIVEKIYKIIFCVYNVVINSQEKSEAALTVLYFFL